jgi:hypothetical protein
MVEAMAMIKKVGFSLHVLRFVRESELPPGEHCLVVAESDGKFWWIRDPKYPDGVNYDHEPPHRLVYPLTGKPWPLVPSVVQNSERLLGPLNHWRTWKDVPALRAGRETRWQKWRRKLWRLLRRK